MGDSEKLDGEDNEGYQYHGQYGYLTELLDQLDLGNSINLIIHDWGSAMGFQFARENPERIKSITYMEAIVMPLTWEQWPLFPSQRHYNSFHVGYGLNPFRIFSSKLKTHS